MRLLQRGTKLERSGVTVRAAETALWVSFLGVLRTSWQCQGRSGRFTVSLELTEWFSIFGDSPHHKHFLSAYPKGSKDCLPFGS